MRTGEHIIFIFTKGDLCMLYTDYLFSWSTIESTEHHELFRKRRVHLQTFGSSLGNFSATQNRWKTYRPNLLIAQATRNAGKDILMPDPRSSNALVCDRKDLPREHNVEGVQFFTGYKADGVILRPSQAAFFATADCPVVVMYSPGINGRESVLAAAHAGRKCLMDDERIKTGRPSREHESVVYALIDRFEENGIPSKDIRVFVCCGIGPEHFDHPMDHPTYGRWNRQLVEDILFYHNGSCILGDKRYGRIDLFQIIRAQCAKRFIREDHIHHDGIDTFAEKDAEGRALYHSHRRYGGERYWRNGILVYMK